MQKILGDTFCRTLYTDFVNWHVRESISWNKQQNKLSIDNQLIFIRP